MKKINKKGTQVSLVLSFVLFTVFLIFVYTIISSSVSKYQRMDNILNSLESEIINNATQEVKVLRFYNNAEEDCLTFNNGYVLKPLSAINEEGNPLKMKTLSSEIAIEGPSGLIKVYSADFLENSEDLTPTTCKTITPQGISIEEHISQMKLINLINDLKEQYVPTKTFLGVDENYNINITFISDVGPISSSYKTPRADNLYSREKTIYYMKNNGVIKQGKLKILLW